MLRSQNEGFPVTGLTASNPHQSVPAVSERSPSFGNWTGSLDMQTKHMQCHTHLSLDPNATPPFLSQQDEKANGSIRGHRLALTYDEYHGELCDPITIVMGGPGMRLPTALER